MSEQQNTESQKPELEDMNPEQREQEEKTILRSRLKTMGHNPSNNASLEKLRADLAAALAGQKPEQEKVAQPMPGTPAAPQKAVSLHQHLRSKAHKLRRVRITCHNPNKRDLPGEFFTIGNNFVGTIKRYVPFGEMTDNGWHIEQAIYDMMKSRQYVDIRSKHDKKTGQIITTTRLATEFGIEDLPDLTPEELKKLGQAQLVAGTSSVG